ncbi:hypothetical protein HZH66_006965 [Vespula vulgaris]|uniref:Uncharacterized protein n=1 Tax=Vespula vulgaris TaxID=7454 RepID=A0A834K2I0_VESVU|nr:hypothetical protein HZH66_006965 [Vespula vulgaris]
MSLRRGQESRRAEEERNQQVRTLTPLEEFREENAGNNAEGSVNGLGFPVKSDNYNGKESVRESFTDLTKPTFSELKLEMRFGETLVLRETILDQRRRAVEDLAALPAKHAFAVRVSKVYSGDAR